MSQAGTYKQRKEDFVSGLMGGSVSEINIVAAVAPVAVLLWSILQARQSFFRPYGAVPFVVDYILNVVILLLATTLYSHQPLLLSLLLVGPATLIYVLPLNHASSRKKIKVPASKDGANKLDDLPVKPFITTYRGFMLVITIIAILAVDFNLFPRRFAKVETWGTSLMDMGVGAFVFSAGIVAARPVLKERATGQSIPLHRRVLGSLRHAIPLFVLGFIRLLSVKGLDYAEHVTEYGVHWNFFFTMGLLPPFVAASQSALSIVPSYAVLSLLIGGIYQTLLETTSLKAYVLTAPRIDLLSMNREGIFSFFGYLAIFLAGQDLGMVVIPRKLTPKSKASAGTQRNGLLIVLALWSAIWWGAFYLSTDYTYGLGLQVSRRLANLPYVLWVAAFNNVLVLAFCIVDTIFFPAHYNATDAKTEREAYLSATSPVMRAYNRNGLALFLVANLLTGLVNMTVDTLVAGRVVTVAILVAYTLVTTVVAVALDVYNISIKI